MRLRTQVGVVFLATLIIYLLTLSQNLAIAHDSSVYVRWIEDSVFLFMPHHLLYTISLRIWLSFCELFIPLGDPVVFITIPNAVAGAASAALVFLILRRNAKLGSVTAFAGTAGAAFSFGFWFYSIAVEVYLIPLVFLLVALYYVSKPDLERSDIWKIGLAHAFGILFHQAHLLLYPALALALLYRSNSIGQSKLRAVTDYTLWSGIPTIAAYVAAIVWYVEAKSIQEGWYWLTLYSHELSDSWNPIALGTLAKAIIGFGRAFIGGHFVFAIPSVRSSVLSGLKGHYFDDEIFLVRDLSQGAAIVWLVLAGVIVIGIVYLAIRTFRSRAFIEYRDVALPLMIGLVIYSIFFFFWDPSNCEFWIPQAVFIWMLLAMGVNRSNLKGPKVTLAICAALVAIVNFGGSIRYAQSKEHDYYYHRVEPYLQSSPKDLVVLSNSWTIKMYFEFYTKVRTLSVAGLIDSARNAKINPPAQFAANTIRADLHHTVSQGGTAYVMADAIHMSDAALGQVHITQAQVDTVWMGMASHLQGRKIGMDSVYLYREE